jgi:penicillin-binding protein 2
VPGIDIAGKTGSAQIVSLATRAKHASNDEFAQNGWFVGFTPRRDPDIIVVTLFEGGEHGKLAARLATQVIKAYVDKQRLQPAKMANNNSKVDIGALWTSPDDGGDSLHSAHFLVDVAGRHLPLATAAPGVQ